MSPAEGFAFLALPLTVTSKRRPPTPSRLALLCPALGGCRGRSGKGGKPAGSSSNNPMKISGPAAACLCWGPDGLLLRINEAEIHLSTPGTLGAGTAGPLPPSPSLPASQGAWKLPGREHYGLQTSTSGIHPK